VNDWPLVYEGFEPGQEKLREALCTVGNGYFCTRGAAPEAAADGIHYPGTYLAGGFNRRTTEIAGRQVENEDLVNFPNWLPLSFRIEEGEWFDLDAVDILSFRQELDLQCGVLHCLQGAFTGPRLRGITGASQPGLESPLAPFRSRHRGKRRNGTGANDFAPAHFPSAADRLASRTANTLKGGNHYNRNANRLCKGQFIRS
jgi:hypothetical protein